jgi:hypothetical protein
MAAFQLVLLVRLRSESKRIARRARPRPHSSSLVRGGMLGAVVRVSPSRTTALSFGVLTRDKATEYGDRMAARGGDTCYRV